jgi:hypothetical protein
MNYIVYKVYYGDNLVYIGRTKQRLIDRMRMHFFGNPLVPKLNIFDVSKIEYALFPTECDQFVYEVYLINLYHPCLNSHDLGSDKLTIYLPEPKFYIWENKIFDKWKDKRIEYLIDTSSLDYYFEDEFY